MDSLELGGRRRPITYGHAIGCVKRIGNSYVIYRHERSDTIITVGPHWYGVILTLVVLCGGCFLCFDTLNSKRVVVSSAMIISFKLFNASTVGLAIVFLLLTACLDPGIVIFHAPIHASNYSLEGSHSENWCEVCCVSQSFKRRVHHCDDCDLCIEGLDHHCPWIGKCIGKKNMKWFIAFNVMWVLALISLLIVVFTF